MQDPLTANALNAAISAARSGNLERARAVAEAALQKGGDAVALNAFLGMVRARAGDAPGAIAHLTQAHHGRPDDVTIACNLIATQIEAADLAGAFVIASRALAYADPTLRVARYRGFLAQALERFEDAVEAYQHVVERAPDDFESWNNLGNARSAAGDVAGSIQALQRALSLDANAPPTRINLATALNLADRADEAETVLIAAAADFPKDARALHALYVMYKKVGRQDEARQALDAAADRDTDNADLQFKRGIEFGIINETAKAEQAYRRAIALDPTMTDAYLGLAVQFEHTNREDKFAALIALAETNAVDAGALGFIRALEHRRAGRFEQGLESLQRVPDSMEPERQLQIRATLLDRLGRTDEAFAAFAASNLLHATSPTDPLRRAGQHREECSAELKMLTPEWVAGWSKALPASVRPDPVFLVGFPRSGTTLLDTLLMGHPAAVVLEEQPPLNHVDKSIGGLAAIATLEAQAIADARTQYFDEVSKLAVLDSASVLIDKSPLFLQKVPLIQRLFPDARFILALRHPCDVVLSCFMSNFRLNSAMSNFLRLEDAAEFYDLVFTHWERSRELFPINVHTVVYEKLVDDVPGEVRPLLNFLGLEWHENVLDHMRTAKARGLITTASYAQVTEPIYTRATGRWRRYRKHLEPVLPTLAPWVEKWGYTLDA